MEKTLNVQGMTCAHCESAVKGALAELDGVKNIEVSLDSGKVDVSYEEGTVTEDQMKEAVEEQGYDVEQ